MSKILVVAAVCLLGLGACGDDNESGDDGGGDDGGGSVAIGASCSSDSNCSSGSVCVALSNVKSDCPGRVCTNTCASDSACTAFDDGDCETVNGNRVCLFGEWEDETLCADY